LTTVFLKSLDCVSCVFLLTIQSTWRYRSNICIIILSCHPSSLDLQQVFGWRTHPFKSTHQLSSSALLSPFPLLVKFEVESLLGAKQNKEEPSRSREIEIQNRPSHFTNFSKLCDLKRTAGQEQLWMISFLTSKYF